MVRSNTKSRNGFSLLELLIVVAIILIIATIAIPSFLRARQSANETGAAASMKAINVAQNVYLMTEHVFGSIDSLVADGLLDERFVGNFGGYSYAISLSNGNMIFEAKATAINDTSGRYDYYAGSDFVIRFTTTTARAPDGRNGEPVQ
jgi:prepilin-type N-terminal cleavage/methylation domain-containing protein